MVVGPVYVSGETGMPVDIEHMVRRKPDVAPKQKITKGMTVDTEILPVSFGGFTPMALSDANVVADEMDEVYDRMAKLREDADAAKQFLEEQAKHQFIGWHYINKLDTNIVIDEERHTVSLTDGMQNVWRLEMVADGTFRVVECEPASAELWVPSQVGDTAVTALAADALASLHDIEAVYIPDTVTSIGLRAFLDCRNLRRLVLPSGVDEFTAQWTRGCSRLEELYLPGGWSRIDGTIFDAGCLKKLVIGAGTKEILPGSFEKSQLEMIEVHPDNQWLSSDGEALYSADGTSLIVLAMPRQHYVVKEGVTTIGKKAFYSMTALESVELPESLEELGPFCFGRTSLASITLPSKVKTVGEKAFFFCEKLQQVVLNGGLETIQDEAFSNSGLLGLELPSSIQSIGKTITLNTPVVYSGEDATFRVAADSTVLEMDINGGLYRIQEDGRHFSRLLDPATDSYQVLDGTAVIDEGSFAGHPAVRFVELPASVHTIKRAAFKAARCLTECKVASTLERIEEEAFLDTVLETFTVPASLSYLGTNALVTKGAHTGVKPSLRKVEVEEGNSNFFTTCGMLCRRYESGRCGVILFDNSAQDVVIPPETYGIASYAFAGVTGIKALTLSDAIASIDICGLKIVGHIENIHIDLQKPYRGHECFDIRFPNTDRGRQQMQLALSVRDHVDMAYIFKSYDSSIGNGSSFDSVYGEEGLSLYDQAVRIIERLTDPVYMNGSSKLMLESFIKKDLVNICVAIARKDDRLSIDGLFDLGFLNEETLLPVIDRVGSLQDAAMTGYLLEVKRRLFKQDVIDFDL